MCMKRCVHRFGMYTSFIHLARGVVSTVKKLQYKWWNWNWTLGGAMKQKISLDESVLILHPLEKLNIEIVTNASKGTFFYMYSSGKNIRFQIWDRFWTAMYLLCIHKSTIVWINIRQQTTIQLYNLRHQYKNKKYLKDSILWLIKQNKGIRRLFVLKNRCGI